MTSLLQVRNLRTSFHSGEHVVPVVDGVDLDVKRGEVLGIIGESGSGKTVTCMSILRLLPGHAAVHADRLLFEGEEIGSLPDSAFRDLRGRKLAMIFQDPVGSFNPVKTIGWHFRQVSRRAAIGNGTGDARQDDAWWDEAVSVLERVGIPHGRQILKQYPHQLSGGMLQRALIALVLQMRPSLIVADEPTTNLDNIVEHQIIELFRGLKQDTQASFIFITHDMSVAASLCDRIAVMYAGQIVEIGATDEILTVPKHPYTQGLVRTATELVRRVERLQEIPGELPNWRSLPEGCRFRPRCPYARVGCEAGQPMRTLDGEARVRCLLYDREAA
ncbi:ABC transporter ATP-binding protein [Rhodoligotrophos defluvii]|uniref:ABC transporter ATP-binding protein n=1 Tax=Rhodoligotrophos defluvii TaxID=2561934 RepID=UPI00148536A8|nr:ABC transporter ATP-binding protein [Rhodoligotrophos defluvii]